MPSQPAEAFYGWLRTLSRHPWVRGVRGLAAGERTGDTLMVALAAAVGLATGLLAVLLINLVAGVQAVAFGTGLPDVAAVLLLPTLGGLIVGLVVTYGVPEVRGSGVSQLMSSIALHGGRIRPVVWIAKLFTSSINLGTGASGGREGPIIQIGGSVGSSLGRLFALDEPQKRALIAAGAGAGIAASFNAPIGGMLFAIEVVIGSFRARYLQVVVVASVVASVTARELVGPDLIYSPPPYRLSDPRELLLYGLLGLAATAAGVGLSRGEHLVSRWTERQRTWPPLLPALGAMGVGVTALMVPEALGSGDHLPQVLGAVTEPIGEMLDGTLYGAGWAAAGALLLLVVAKLAATSMAIGTGNSVGSFTPSVFLGAALGGAFGHASAALLPAAAIQPGAFALAGMAGVVGAATRAPLTAILLAFELTGDYGMVVPLMLTTGIATLAADRIDRESIYSLPLSRRGIVYAEPEDVDIMQTVRVGEIMTTNPVTVPAELPLAELNERFRRTRLHGFPVLSGDRLIGVVTVSDLARVADSTGDIMAPDRFADGDITAERICTPRPATVTPNDPVFVALRRMASMNVGRLPVVSAEDHGILVGLVRRADIIQAYQQAVSRQLGAQQRKESSRLRDLGGAQFVELQVDAQAPAAGRAVRDITWPRRTVVTSVRRGAELIVPRGDTVLEPGDELVVLTDLESVEEMRALVSAP